MVFFQWVSTVLAMFLHSKPVTLSLTQEAAASVKALMEDGEFDGWLGQGVFIFREKTMPK